MIEAVGVVVPVHDEAELLPACLSGAPLARTWLATTDADSRVPASWLVEHLRIADAGVEAVAGTIRVDWSGHPPGLGEAFARFHEPPGSGDDQIHVHGANLGVRGDAYVAAGGFAPLPTGEDHALWRALAARARVATRRVPVVTSSRRGARAPSGFSGFLAAFPAMSGEPA